MSNKFLGLNSVNVLKDYIDKEIQTKIDDIEIDYTDAIKPDITAELDENDGRYYWVVDGKHLMDGESKVSASGIQGPKGEQGTFANTILYDVPIEPVNSNFIIDTNICTYIGNTTFDYIGCDVYGNPETFEYGYIGKIINVSPSTPLIVTNMTELFFNGVDYFNAFKVLPGKSVEVIGIRVNDNNRFFVHGDVTKPNIVEI